MIGIIFLECWADNNNIVKMLVVFFFNQLEDKVSFSTTRLANKYACMRLFDIACHFLFDAGFVLEE